MLYPQEIIEEVRLANDIVGVVGTYVPLKQKGSNYFGLCPFHNEKTPSFSVSADKQIFHCFGCGATGNVYGFLMRVENFNFVEALRFLSDRIHYKLPEQGDSEQAKQNALVRDTLFEMNKSAGRFFYDCLNSDLGAPARRYLDERTVSEKARVKFRLGFSPHHREELYRHLLELGYDPELIKKSGLVVPSKRGGYIDKFYSRLMFPIMDAQKRIVGFGGRTVSNGEPKYLNSPDTPVFDKSRNLYGINFVRLSRKKEIILVEGYMDVIGLFQAGFDNTVAALGTALNPEHAKLIKRYADSVIILFDSDEAGTRAALRAIPILEGAGLKVKATQVVGAKDPDEYILKYGPDAFGRLMSGAKSHITFQVNHLKGQYDLNNIDQKVIFTNEVAKILSRLDNEVEREVYVDEISKLTAISGQAIKTEVIKLSDKSLNVIRKDMRAKSPYKSGGRAEKGADAARRGLLGILWANPELCGAVKPYLEPEELEDEAYVKLLRLIYERSGAGKELLPAEILNHFETNEEQEKIAGLFMVQEPFETEFLEKAVNDSVKTIKRNNLDKKVASERDADKLQMLIESKRNIDKLYIKVLDG